MVKKDAALKPDDFPVQVEEEQDPDDHGENMSPRLRTKGPPTKLRGG